MKTVRFALLAATTALALTASLAGAAPTSRAQVTDPAGDALAPGFDIVSAQLSTTGATATRKVGQRVLKTYTPKTLVATITLAQPPSTTPGTSIQLHVATTACGGGYFEYQYTPGALVSRVSEPGDLFVSGCGPSSGTGASEYLPDVRAQVKGSTITWTMPLSDMGSDLPLNTVFSGFRVSADINEPVTGLAGGSYAGRATNGAVGDIDDASSDATWKLG